MVDLSQPLTADREAGLIKRIKEIVETQMRYSYRRIYVLLGRARWPSENYGNARGR
jgi:hypothetical protein